MPNLPKFEGHQVIRSSCKITKAGDGLSEALRLDPTALRHDEEVYFVLRGKVTQVNHVPTGPLDDTLVRVHTIVTQEITRVSEEVADPALREAAAILEQAKAAENGQDPIPGTEATASVTVPIGSAAKRPRRPRTRKPKEAADE